jgi:hypothetical protein
MRIGPTIFMAVFTLGWSAVTCIAAGAVGSGMIQQLHTWSYASAPGEIDGSGVEGAGDSAQAKIDYHYTVAGVRHEGTRRRFGGGSDGDSAGRRAAAFPRGAKVPVFYDPRQPDQAVLVRGVEGMDLFLCQFITPFVLVAIALWIQWGRALLASRLLGTSVRVDENTLRLRPGMSVVLVPALALMGLAAFLGVFPMLPFYGFDPPLWLASLVWTSLLAMTVAAMVACARQRRRGALDVVLDDAARTLSVRGRSRLRYDQVTCIRISTSKPTAPAFTNTFEILAESTGDPAFLTLHATGHPLPARRLGLLLATRLGVPLEGP